VCVCVTMCLSVCVFVNISGIFKPLIMAHQQCQSGNVLYSSWTLFTDASLLFGIIEQTNYRTQMCFINLKEKKENVIRYWPKAPIKDRPSFFRWNVYSSL